MCGWGDVSVVMDLGTGSAAGGAGTVPESVVELSDEVG